MLSKRVNATKIASASVCERPALCVEDPVRDGTGRLQHNVLRLVERIAHDFRHWCSMTRFTS